MEFGYRAVGLHALGLVDRQVEPRLGFAQIACDRPVARRQAGAAVDDENHSVGFGDCLLRLPRHLDVDALRGRLEAAGIDYEVRAAAQAPVTVVPVTRHPGQVVHDGVAAACEPVEESRLADVGPPDEGDHRLQGERAYKPPFCVCTSTAPEASTSGAARTGPPPAEKRPTKLPESRARKWISPSKSPVTTTTPLGRGNESWRLLSFSCFQTDAPLLRSKACTVPRSSATNA